MSGFPSRRLPYQRPKPTPGQIAAAMRALAPDAEADARIMRTIRPEPQPERSRSARRGLGSNARRGLAVEGVFGGRGVAAALRREGYIVIRSHQSQGAADVIGLLDLEHAGQGPAVRAVQAKRQRLFRPDGLNEAVARFLGVGRYAGRSWALAPEARREAWLWLDGHGWIARVLLGPDGGWTVEGDAGEEVDAALRRMMTRLGPTT